MTGEQTAVHAAGRTDAGVHALAMTAHVDIAKPLTGAPAARRAQRPGPARSDRRSSPPKQVADDWHARFSCIGRQYRVSDPQPPRPAGHSTRAVSGTSPAPLDVEAMAAGAAMLVGRHDFTTFRSVQCQSDSPVKTLDRLDVVRDGDEVRIEAAARSFLHHQVRSMVGCLAMVGRGQWAPDDIRKRARSPRPRGPRPQRPARRPLFRQSGLSLDQHFPRWRMAEKRLRARGQAISTGAEDRDHIPWLGVRQ